MEKEILKESELTETEATLDDGRKILVTLNRFNTFRPWPIDQMYAGDNYVASAEFMDSLVRGMVVESVARREKLPTDEAIKGDLADCREAAKIVLGQDSRFQTIPFYSPGGGIDAHLAKWAGISDANPNKRVMGAFVAMLTEILEVVNQMDEYLEEQWSFQIDVIINHYVGLLMGFTPGQMAAAE